MIQPSATLTPAEETALRQEEAAIDRKIAQLGMCDVQVPSPTLTDRALRSLLLMYQNAGYEILPDHVASGLTRIQPRAAVVQKKP